MLRLNNLNNHSNVLTAHIYTISLLCPVTPHAAVWGEKCFYFEKLEGQVLYVDSFPAISCAGFLEFDLCAIILEDSVFLPRRLPPPPPPPLLLPR